MPQQNGERKPKPAERVTMVRYRDLLGDLANRVEYGGKRIVVTRRGKDAFALVPMDDFLTLKGAA